MKYEFLPVQLYMRNGPGLLHCRWFSHRAPPGAAVFAPPPPGIVPARTMIDLTPALRPLYKGSIATSKQSPQWQPKHRANLTSAINGGQWPQARKAKLKNWQHGNLCQLCNQATGTVAHRRSCPATVPPEGWPQPWLDDQTSKRVGRYGLQARRARVCWRSCRPQVSMLQLLQIQARGLHRVCSCGGRIDISRRFQV